MLPLFENGKPQDLPEQLDINLSYLQLCGPFLISTSPNSAALIINLNEGKIEQYLYDAENPTLLSCSAQFDTTIFLWQDKIIRMKVCASDDEYIEMLLERKEYDVLQKFSIESNIKDLERLKTFIDPNHENKEFDEYIEKVKLSLEPQSLKVLHPDLFDNLMKMNVPTDEIMQRIHDMLHDLVIDEETQNKIQYYVLNKPDKWSQWDQFLNIDELVSTLNEKEETAFYAMQIAKNGTSPLSKILSQIDSLPVDFCVANSPPIHNYNLSGQRRKLFDDMLRSTDIFSEANSSITENNSLQNQEVLDDSPFTTRVEELKDSEISPEEAHKLLLLDEWENGITNLVQELHQQAEAYYLSEGVKDIPFWVNDVLKGGKVFQQNSGCGNWGATSQMKECPICGMPITVDVDPTGAALFPCTHCFHNSCLRSRRYCPLCYSLSME